MKKKIMIISGLIGLAGMASAATIIDGFGTVTKDGNLSSGNIDGTWHGYGTTEAVMVSGSDGTLTMTNPTEVTNDRRYESAVGIMIDNTGGTFSGGQIKVEFDYTTLAGTPKVYFHLGGFNATGGSPSWTISTSQRNGSAGATDVDGGSYELSTGSTSFGYSGATTGTGTISLTYDLSGYDVTDLADYEYLAGAFAWDMNTQGDSIEISNFSVTAIPEPSSIGLMVGLGAIIAVGFRRRMA
jgi:hypothetical protein